jgi:hypothetical protein
MKLQPGDLVRPNGHWPPNSRLGGIELALVVSIRRPELAALPVGVSLNNWRDRAEIQVLGGKKDGMRLSTWDSSLQKVE